MRRSLILELIVGCEIILLTVVLLETKWEEDPTIFQKHLFGSIEYISPY